MLASSEYMYTNTVSLYSRTTSLIKDYDNTVLQVQANANTVSTIVQDNANTVSTIVQDNANTMSTIVQDYANTVSTRSGQLLHCVHYSPGQR